jgi:hypothetical protein
MVLLGCSQSKNLELVAHGSMGASRDELSDYLNSPLEKVDLAGVIS